MAVDKQRLASGTKKPKRRDDDNSLILVPFANNDAVHYEYLREDENNEYCVECMDRIEEFD